MNQEELLNLSVELGAALIKSGAETYRVEESVTMFASACHRYTPSVFAVPTCIIVTLTDDKVTRTEWRYNYSCDSDTAKQQSEDLYNQVVEVSDRLMDVERNSLCKDKNNMTSTYKNRMETVRDIEQGIPYVSITVTDDFSLIIY